MKTLLYPFALFLFTAAIMFMALSHLREPPKTSSLPMLGQLDGFSFTDHRDNEFSLENTRGKLTVFGFFFSRCKAECSLLTSNIERLATLFDSESGVQFAAITVDPAYDTPDVLSRYSKKFSGHFANWYFLTGKISDVEKFMREGLKIGTHDDPSLHTTRLVLVDRTSSIRGYYSGLDDDAIERLISDLTKL